MGKGWNSNDDWSVVTAHCPLGIISITTKTHTKPQNEDKIGYTARAPVNRPGLPSDRIRFQCRLLTLVFFFVVSWGGVRPSPLGTSASIWPIVPAPDEVVGGMKIGRGNRSTGENLSYFHFVHHKSHMTWPGIQPRRLTAWAMVQPCSPYLVSALPSFLP
jgi:hypothetical protein